MKLTFLSDPTAPTAAYAYTCELQGQCTNCKKCPKGKTFCDNTLILLECPFTTYKLIQTLSFKTCDDVCIILKNLDLEYLSGISKVINLLYDKFRIRPRIIIEEYEHPGLQEICSHSGARYAAYRLYAVDKFYYDCHVDWFSHPSGGFELTLGNTTVFYTGHTHYYTGIFGYIDICKTPPENIEFYVDVSGKKGTETKLKDILKKLIKYAQKGIKVYLMNVESVPATEKLIAGHENIQIVSTQ